MNLNMWKFQKGIYAFQTSDPSIAKKMKDRKSFTQTIFPVSPQAISVFICKLPGIREAKQRFKNIFGRSPKYNAVEQVYE